MFRHYLALQVLVPQTALGCLKNRSEDQHWTTIPLRQLSFVFTLNSDLVNRGRFNAANLSLNMIKARSVSVMTESGSSWLVCADSTGPLKTQVTF